MHRLRRSARLGLTAALFVASAAAPIAWAGPPPRQVNVTSDSAAGWLPTPEQEAAARKAAEGYLAAMDAGRFRAAYAMQADGQKALQPLEAYSARVSEFNALAGPVKERRLTTVTWTKDPHDSPSPGIYVAIDLVSRFANIDRHCGYLMLYQSTADDPFMILRQEDNYLDNTSAAKIAKFRPADEVEKTWATLSARCPSYRGTDGATAPPLPESKASIGYPSVAAALADLRTRPGVVMSSVNGWTVASDEQARTMWSFPPPGDRAYPSAVKRKLITDGKGVSLSMRVRCEASKAACDALVRTFQTMNAQLSGTPAKP